MDEAHLGKDRASGRTAAARSCFWGNVAALALLGSIAALLALTVPSEGQALPPGAADARPENDGARKVEFILERELARRLGGADRWEIAVTASQEEREQGRLPKIEVRGWNLRLPDGQVLAEVELTAEKVALDLRHETLTASADVRLTARLRPEDLARFIERKAGGKVRDVRLAIRGDQLDERFSVHAGPFRLRVHRVAMSYVDGNTVSTRARRVTVDGIRLTKGWLRRIERHVNPILDGSKLPVPVQFEEVGIRDGLLEARVRLDLAALPAAKLPERREDSGREPSP
jgi:hypothetical protein